MNLTKRVLVACQIFEPELEMLRTTESIIEIRYLDQGLHRYPHKMPSLVQDQIDQVAARADKIVLGYGLCSNGRKCPFFNKKFLEIQGDLGYLKKMLYGPYTDEDFFYLKPGDRIEQKMFLDYPSQPC